MQEDAFAPFVEYAISYEESRMIQGGGQFLNQAIIQQLCEKRGYEIPLNEWEHADYRYWAHQIGISINTLKGWVCEGINPRKDTQKRLLELSDCKEWTELERDIILKNNDKTK